MRKLFLSILMTSSVLAWAGDVVVSSPDGQLQVTVNNAGGRLFYSATHGGQTVMEPSALGLKTSIGDFTRDLSLLDNHRDEPANERRHEVQCGLPSEQPRHRFPL